MNAESVLISSFPNKTKTRRRVNWNIKNREGDTPLMHCLKDCKTEIAGILLNNPKVDLDIVDSNGRHLEDIARSDWRNQINY